MEKKLRLLFIGNSHTFFNYMPNLVAERFRKDGYDCEVTMLARPYLFLKEHLGEQETKFNIKYGHYDYVILQEHAHPFGPVEDFREAVMGLDEMIKESGSKSVIYMTWAAKDEPEKQDFMTKAHRDVASEIGALLAPVGEEWWKYLNEHLEAEYYYKDGHHASAEGSAFAARVIWETIQADLEIMKTQ